VSHDRCAVVSIADSPVSPVAQVEKKNYRRKSCGKNSARRNEEYFLFGSWGASSGVSRAARHIAAGSCCCVLRES
jgi:hypothetical protein